MKYDELVPFLDALTQLVRIKTIEQCILIVHEQRCERETPWDLACLTISEKLLDGYMTYKELCSQTIHMGYPLSELDKMIQEIKESFLTG